MYLGYNTNGLCHHDLCDAIKLLSDIGYQGVGITLDHRALNPFDTELTLQLKAVGDLLQRERLRCVIETGARYLLDPRTKHEPTLVTANASERARRVDFLCRAIDIAAQLRADCVSLWSGIQRDSVATNVVYSRLADSLAPVLGHAAAAGVRLAFEPEPGMLVDTLSSFRRLLAELDQAGRDTSGLGLTIDVGHLHCQGEVPIADQIAAHQNWLANVHIEDMRAGVHEHLMFGEGEIDFPPVIAALAKIGYAGMLGVELSRHSHEGPETARRAYQYLSPLVSAVRSQVSAADAEPPMPGP